jgi:hypothetical protein
VFFLFFAWSYFRRLGVVFLAVLSLMMHYDYDSYLYDFNGGLIFFLFDDSPTSTFSGCLHRAYK